MRTKSFHKKLTVSYIYLLIAVAVIMLLGLVLTVWISVLPSMRITMQSISSLPRKSSTRWKAPGTALMQQRSA